MTIEWMVYAVVVASLVSVAAWLADRGARAQRWRTRWVWAAGLAVSVVAPVVAWLRPTAPAPLDPAAAPAGAAGAALTGEYLLQIVPQMTGGLQATGPGVETVLLAGWAASTAALLLAVAWLWARLALDRRAWPTRVVDGVELLVSERTGPAAIGVLRGRVVVPRWALELAPERRRLLLLHEVEHVRARDPQLAFLGLLVCAAAPWNLPLWWQLRRLRLAIEMDCDARVLRRSGSIKTYGDLLLDMGQRRARLALALAEAPGLLERRIRMIVENGRPRARVRGGMLIGVAGLVLAVACAAPEPVMPSQAEADVQAGPEMVAGEERAQQPALDVLAPSCAAVFVDGDRVPAEALDPDLGGRIDRIEVVKGKELENAGLGDACGLIWIETTDAPGDLDTRLRQLLGTAAPARRAPAERPLPAPETAEPISAAPTFTPMTQRPRLVNPDEVRQTIQDYYPPLLKDAGIGGTANVWLFIDETGRVTKTQVNRSSGYEALDQAALTVAREMEFEPAMNRDERVAVWVALDIAFEVQ